MVIFRVEKSEPGVVKDNREELKVALIVGRGFGRRVTVPVKA